MSTRKKNKNQNRRTKKKIGGVVDQYGNEIFDPTENKRSVADIVQNSTIGRAAGLYRGSTQLNKPSDIKTIMDLNGTERWSSRTHVYDMYVKKTMIDGVSTPFVSWKFKVSMVAVDMGFTGKAIVDAIGCMFPNKATQFKQALRSITKSRTFNSKATNITYETPRQIIITPNFIMIIRNEGTGLSGNIDLSDHIISLHEKVPILSQGCIQNSAFQNSEQTIEALNPLITQGQQSQGQQSQVLQHSQGQPPQSQMQSQMQSQKQKISNKYKNPTGQGTTMNNGPKKTLMKRKLGGQSGQQPVFGGTGEPGTYGGTVPYNGNIQMEYQQKLVKWFERHLMDYYINLIYTPA